jgi:2'-5' RNA ligase
MQLGALAARLAQAAPRARAVPAANLHLTLAFVGKLEPEDVVQLAGRLSARATAEFDWCIDRIGYFDRARVVWAGGPDNAALHDLARDVRGLLDSMAVAYDRKPFVAHVTLLRDVRRWRVPPTSVAPPILWKCGTPTLVRSMQAATGVVYMPVSG